MKRSRLVLPCSALLLIGCEGGERIHDDAPYGSTGVPMVQMMNTESVDNGILAQHTLFPHHFVVNAAKLNELGRRDLGVLARHFLTAPGQVNVRRGVATAQLYEARVATVRQEMIDVGVDPERITIDSGLPGGSGMSSDFVLSVIEDLTGGGTGTPGAGKPAVKPVKPMSTGIEGGRNVGSSY